MIDKTKFINPDTIYRSAPFWALNDLLEANELKRQIGEFHEKGMGGAFLHPRGGLMTEYLSEDYFDAIKACIDEFKKHDMICWLYDEDGFPSGVAGGKVLEENPDYSQQELLMEICAGSDFKATDNTLVIYKTEGASYRMICADEIEADDRILSISKKQSPPDASFNYHSYVDVCNKKAIDCFIKITHDKYYSKFKNSFGKTIKAIFTDEPSFNPNSKNGLPWTAHFEEQFYKKYKYNIIDKLIELFIDTGNYYKTRFDYWDLLTHLFVEAFSKNIYNWCEARGIAYTGHYWEHVFPNPSYNGSVMPHYEYMQYPGIDMLFVSDEKSPEMYGNDFIVKEASSIANQLGKERILSETYGASGWGLDFKHQKIVADWQLALGVNLFCQHLSLFSMKSYRKRDFPLSFLDHQPWWEHYGILGDYLGRMSYALSQGKFQADVLVLHPSSSTWVSYGAMEKNKELLDIEESVKSLIKNLNQLKIMNDLGDEGVISKHGKVKDGTLIIGHMSYKVVILPKMKVLRKSVFDLLKSFSDNGGIVITTGDAPVLLDGVYSEEVSRFFNDKKIVKVDNIKGNLSNTLYSLNVERVRIKESNNINISNIYSHIRRQGDKEIIFLCNLDLGQNVNLEMYVDGPYFAESYNAENGEINRMNIYLDEEGKYYVKIDLYAANSRLILIDKSKNADIKKENIKFEKIKTISLLDWDVQTLDKNAFNLQFCSVFLDEEKFCDTDDVLALDNKLKDKLGIERGNVMMRQPWMYSLDEKNKHYKIKAEYNFFVEKKPKGSLMAAIESPEIFKVFINNELVEPTNDYYANKEFVLYDIKSHVQTGKNEITLRSDQYGILVNLESIYVIGDFKLKKKGDTFCITEKTTLETGNLVQQGYPYYSGVVSYHAEVDVNEQYNGSKLVFDGFDGVVALVKINGQHVSTLGWEPYVINIGPYLKRGSNDITIEIANSLQNLLGPFGKKENLNKVTPNSFYCDKHEQFLPIGFNGNAEILLEK